jgi:prepilin-type N-terminal cleavage/methylation domain-containing protein
VRQRGTTLVELVIVVAIIAMIAAALWTLPQGARRNAMTSAASQFDAALAYAQALAASSGNGATMVFEERVSALGSPIPGFVLSVYSGRPTAAGALKAAPMPPMQSVGEVREAKLGNVPFTIFLNSAGHASGMIGKVNTAGVLASDPGCPAGESSIVLTFSDPRTSGTRSIACNNAIAGAPVAIGTVAPEPSAPPVATPTPSPVPTPTPTQAPTSTPTQAPTQSPTQAPTQAPTPVPTASPTPTPAPTPNPLCTPDGLGWCAAVVSRTGKSVTCYYWNETHTKRYRDQQWEPSTKYDVYNRGLLLYVDTDTWVWNEDCPPTSDQQWTPGEPSMQSGDPNLP